MPPKEMLSETVIIPRLTQREFPILARTWAVGYNRFLVRRLRCHRGLGMSEARQSVRRWLLSGALGVVIAVAAGCRSDPYNLGPRAPVRGKITVDGKPLRTGIITFLPDNARGNQTPHQPSANIDSNGNYELFTVGEAQAPLGWYRIVVLAYERDDDVKGKRPDVPARLIKADYEDPGATPLALEVTPDRPAGGYDLHLSSK